MDLSFLIRGLVIGFSIAAPVGPIGILCIRRTLTEGRLSGLVSGLGAATADALYGCIAGFGLTLISNTLISYHIVLRLIGGIFLYYLGITTFLATPFDDAATTRGNGLVRAYLSTLLLTLTNPMTILSFAAIFAGLGLAGSDGSYGTALLLVGGVFAGSVLWWLLLSSGAGLFRTWLNSHDISWMNKISGAIIASFGILALASLL